MSHQNSLQAFHIEVRFLNRSFHQKDSSTSQVMTPPNEVGIRSINKAEVPVTSQDKNDAISEDQTDPTCEDIQLKLVSVKEARIKADKMMKNEKLKPPSSTEGDTDIMTSLISCLH